MEGDNPAPQEMTEKEPSPTMLYVSNLPFSATDEDLAEIFSEFEVESAYVAVRRNGRSKGFGFVTFPNQEVQLKALEKIDGLELDERTLTVKVAHKDERRDDKGQLKEEFRTAPAPRKNRSKNRGGNSGGEPHPTVVYVGNLPFSFGDEDLENLFTEAGFSVVNVRIARRRNGRSKGFGFVELESNEMQTAAIEKLDGSIVEEREVIVKVSQTPLQAPEGQDNNNGGGRAANRPPSEKNVYVSNLPFEMEDDALGAIFADKGFSVVSSRVARRRNGRSKGFGFVEFENQEEQQRAQGEMDGVEIDGRPLSVKIAMSDPPADKARPAPRPKVQSKTSLYVSNLPFTAGDDDLLEIFAGYNPVTAYVAVRRNGRSKGFGFVEFGTEGEQQAALSMNGTNFEERELTVQVANNTPEPENVEVVEAEVVEE